MNKKLLIYVITFTSMASNVYAFTEVGGIIDTNTVWTVENSPYVLKSNIQVAYGTTLTIEPGVTVDGNDMSIRVYGSLEAVGSDELKIIFNNVPVKGGTTPTEPFSIVAKFSEITGATICDGKDNSGGRYGSLILQDSVIRNTGSHYSEIYVPVSPCYIERNVFDNAGGIVVTDDYGVGVYIRNNVFHNQVFYAVKSQCSLASAPIVRYNSFLSNDRIALRLGGYNYNSSMVATENYWNTTDANVIDSMIWDRNDDLFFLNYIFYEPILTEPHANTPVFLLDQELTIQTEPNYINTVIPPVGQHIVNGWVDVNATWFIDCPEVYSFDHWEGGVDDPNSANTRVFMDADKIITAVFVDDRQCGDECHPYPAGDISKNCIVDFNDFALFCENWLECTKPECD